MGFAFILTVTNAVRNPRHSLANRRLRLGWLGIAAVILMQSACTGDSAKSQWVLREYDHHKGYTFVHDNAVYQTSCFATGFPMLADKKPDLSPKALPPDIANSQSDCDEVLHYLGKSVPNLTRPYPSILLFVGKDNWRLEFMIENAK
jgi:hypothetical protein